MTTREELDEALEAWHVARETAMREHDAWRITLGSHRSLIDSLRENGHTWSKAEAEFQRISDAHSDAYLAAVKAMDERCRDYQKLRAQFEAQ